ncbi:MAG: hypothetical protein V4553_18055 [Bacteroidota bacterium]
MGLHEVEKCIFTDLPVQNVVDEDVRDAIEYWLPIDSHRIFFRISQDAIKWGKEDEFFQDNRHIFQGLIINNDWIEDQTELITIEKLKELISQKSFPRSPQEKADNLFNYLFAMPKEDGKVVQIELMDAFWKKLYFKSSSELVNYIRYLNEQELIIADIYSSFISYNITFQGLNYGIRLQSQGEKSNLCFVAMAFKHETLNIRNAIKEALIETGFQPIIIDEQNIDSDKTINDEIIASLKRCRFCVADFSYHSKGVYFESGFALGQGKKVIYTCLDREFNEAHFDIKPLQHIIYATAEQLKKDLINKIDAWIK